MTKIVNRFTGNLICEDALLNLKELAVKNKANLREANLRGANLNGANLRGANLRGVNLDGANLLGANLLGANLDGANLDGANLRGVNLLGANLRGANLRGAKIEDSEIINYKDISGIGTSRRQLRCFLLKDNSFYFITGCFSRTEEELIIKVKEKYGSDCEYLEAIEFLKNLCKKYKWEKNDK